MLRLEIEDVWTYLNGESAFGIVDSVTSYAVHGRWHSQAYRKKQWDGIKRFRVYDRRRQQYKIPTGFVSRVLSELDKLDYPYEAYDERSIGCPDPVYVLEDRTLKEGRYDYQQFAVAAACSHGRGVIQAATGAGKSTIGAAIIKSFGGNALWLTHRVMLLHQTRKALEKSLGQDVGILGDGQHEIKPVTVAMVQTLDQTKKGRKEILDYLGSLNVFIADEVHHLESAQWTRTIELLNAPHRFGLSATPSFKGPGMAIIGACGDVIYRIGPQELIERGVLVPPNIWIMRHNTPEITETAYQTVYKKGVVECQERNLRARSAALELKQERIPSVTLIRQLRHGRVLKSLYEDAGIKVEFIYSGVKDSTREGWLNQLRDGELDHVIAVAEILGEGVDLPWLGGLINATGSKGGGSASSGAEHEVGRVTTQILGRGLRNYPGKTHFEYFDFSDTHNKHLAKATKDRITTLEEQGYASRIKYASER